MMKRPCARKENVLKPEAKKLLILLLVNSLILIPLYFLLAEVIEFAYTHYIYLLAVAVLGLYYVIYNRGFIGKNVTPENLPGTMSSLEKQRFIDDCAERLKKSRWALTLIIPILLTFVADIAFLYLLPRLEVLLG